MVSYRSPDDAAVRFGILGSLRLEIDGREVQLRSAKQRALLGALLVQVGEVVSTDRLAEVAWAAAQPADPAATIHTHLSRLRSSLEMEGGTRARDVVVTRPGGYLLAVEPDRVDAGRFEELLSRARATSAPRGRVELLREALQLWRGPALTDLDHQQAIAEAARLEGIRTEGQELWADAMLRLGRNRELAAELEVPVSREPLRECLRGQLMVALYRSGRQADALSAYRQLRDQLVEELGVEPSAALRELERAILQQAAELPWPAPPVPASAGTDASTARGARSRTAAMPAQLTSFVGRAADMGAVIDALREQRIVVLTGPGGVGKSRLAAHVAREVAGDYADGVAWCDLGGAEGASAVSGAIATVLGMAPAQRSGADGVMELLGFQHVLLVLDNCEHVLDAASALADQIALGCPGVDVLATSRQRLGASGEQVWPIMPLDVTNGATSEAVELFCDRAVSVDPRFELTASNRQPVRDLCQRLDGLPLAIELAAAQTRSMTPADIADRLERRSDVLAPAGDTTPVRHRSLHAVLHWSYELLPVTTRRLFDRLCVFAGGFDLDGARRVCAGDGVPADEVAGRVAELVDHSLVVVDHSGRHARYRLLESLRAFGEVHLDERGELATWRRRHADHASSLAAAAAEGLHGPDEARWVGTVDTELVNLRAAHHWACTSGDLDVALELPGLLRAYAYHRLCDEMYGWAQRALCLPGASAHPASPAALLTAAVGSMQRGELARAHEEGAEVLARTSDEYLSLRVLQMFAEIALYQGRLGEVDRLAEEIVDRSQTPVLAYFEALGHLYRVHAASYGDRPEEARAQLRDGWHVVARAGTPSLRAAYCYLEGEVRLDAEPQVALGAFRQAIEHAGPVRNRFLVGVARVAVASLQARHGQTEEALVAFRELVDHWRSCGDWVHLWTTLHNLLALFERVGADEAAAVLHGAVGTAALGARPFGADAARLEASATALRESLGEASFAAADTRGRGMSDAHAVTFALEQIEHLLAAGTADAAE